MLRLARFAEIAYGGLSKFHNVVNQGIKHARQL